MGIPIVIGVTGHRALREGDVPALRAAVSAQLRALKERCPASELKLLCSLAAGADMLCAEEALALGLALICPLPLPVEDYETDFSGEDLARFRALLARAEAVFVAPAAEPAPASETPGRDFAYRQAGIYVAVRSHILLALWDGAPAGPGGCGAASAVDFHLKGAWAPAGGFPLRNADNGTVIHILTPRDGADEGPAGTVAVLGDTEAMKAILAQTEEFNRLAAGAGAPAHPLFPEGTGDPVLERIEEVYAAADTLSLRSAVLYRRMLAALAAAATVLTLAFLLYDEVGLTWMILVCGAMLLIAWGCRRAAARSGCHRRYLEYRALAEAARVQAFLRFGGSAAPAAGLFTWSQRDELAWVLDALWALSAAPPPKQARDVRDRWIEEQRAYHAAATGRSATKLRRGNRLVNAAFLASIVFYIAALVFELTLGGLAAHPAAMTAGLALCRTALKIVLGTLSAGALFSANYYGKLSLPRQTADHGKMARFYAAVGEAFDQQGQTEPLMAAVAREELAENANWYVIQKENTPDFSL